MSSIQDNLMLRITSDVHLGGGDSHPDLFRSMLVELLRDIKEKDPETVPRILLILGDIFAFICNNIPFLII